MLAYGKNVLLSTNPKEIKKVYINKNKKDKEVMDFLKKNHIKYLLTETNMLNKICKQNHQGIIIEREEYTYFKLEEIINEEFLVILDHIEDPHNFGAIIRTCEAAGVKGIIIPKDRSVNVNDTVIKTSVGTTSYIKIVKVTNIVTTMKELKEKADFIALSNNEDGVAKFIEKNIL